MLLMLMVLMVLVLLLLRRRPGGLGVPYVAESDEIRFRHIGRGHIGRAISGGPHRVVRSETVRSGGQIGI